MMKHLLMGAALGVALGLSASVASVAPAATNMLETLKASAAQSSIVEDVGHRRRHKARQLCWWGDRWLCKYFW